MRRLALALVGLSTLAAAACGGGDDPTPTPTPEPTSEATATATPTGEPNSTVLAPQDIFARVSPSVAFIQTPAGTGSGFVINEQWLVSNAHVVWPYEEVRVVFGDGTEFLDAKVHAWDMVADLAAIRLPEGHGIPAVEFGDPSELATGSELFLIGYPAETEDFPEPTISSGVLSRFREWPAAELTYVQTDAAITGGQSGGTLVSDTGLVVGLSGFKFADTFGLALAGPIVERRTNALIEGSDINVLSDRRFPTEVSDRPVTFTLDNYYAERAFIVREPAGTVVDVTINSANDAILDVYDAYGTYFDTADATAFGAETISFEVDVDLPFVVVARQLNIGPGDFEIAADPGLAPLDDPDDGRLLRRERTYIGNMDYPADVDQFELDLVEGETVTIRAESILFDPDLAIDLPDNDGDALGYDDDSAGGMFGTDAELTFTAPSTARYIVSVADFNFADAGGYYLILD